VTLRKLLLGTIAASLLAISPAYATDAQLHTPLPGDYHNQTGHIFHFTPTTSLASVCCRDTRKGGQHEIENGVVKLRER
jgi:hypothetical protein